MYTRQRYYYGGRPHRTARRHYTKKSIQATIDAIRPEETHLNISPNIILPTKTELLQALRSIPPKINTLNLGALFESLVTPEEFFATLPNTITSISITSSWNLNAALGDKSTTGLTALFAALPRDLINLTLQFNKLGSRADTDFSVTFAALPPNLRTLNLAHNNLGAFELKDAFSTLPLHLRELELSNNYFGNGPETDLAIACIPTSVSKLNLSNNELSIKSMEELINFLAAIPEGVRFLDLAGNSLGEIPSIHLAAAVAALPPNVTWLNFSDNSLASPNFDLSLVCAAFPRTISYLGLASNNLGHKKASELVSAFSAFKPGIKSLDISLNDLHKITSSKLALAFASLTDSIKEITLHYKDIANRSNKRLTALGRALPHLFHIKILGAKLTMYSDWGNPIVFDDNRVDLIKKHMGGWVIEGCKQLLELKNIKGYPQFTNDLVLEILSWATGQEDELFTFLTNHSDLLEKYSLFKPNNNVAVTQAPSQCCSIS
jgi:hypothetical protein